MIQQKMIKLKSKTPRLKTPKKVLTMKQNFLQKNQNFLIQLPKLFENTMTILPNTTLKMKCRIKKHLKRKKCFRFFSTYVTFAIKVLSTKTLWLNIQRHITRTKKTKRNPDPFLNSRKENLQYSSSSNAIKNSEKKVTSKIMS